MNLLDSQNWKKIKEELFEKYVEDRHVKRKRSRLKK